MDGKLKPFSCPQCGRTIMLSASNKRKICPDCSYENQLQRVRELAKKQRQDRKNEAAMRKNEPQKPEENPGHLEMQKHDAEIDARNLLQMQKQCRQCDYYARDCGIEYCDFYSHTGRFTDKGNGPGDCRSFVKRGTMTQTQRMNRKRIWVSRKRAGTDAKA